MRTRFIQACNNIASAIIAESIRREVEPVVVVTQVHTCLQNKLSAVIAANPNNVDELFKQMAANSELESKHVRGEWEDCPATSLPVPSKILYSGNRTIVFWNDGSKTIVKCAEDQSFDEYSGFVAAFAKKMFGSTSRVKKLIDDIKTCPIPKKSAKDKLSQDNADSNI